MIIGYAKVATTDQNLGIRHDDLKPAFNASVDPTNVASLRRLPLHKGLQDTKLHQIEADRRKYA
jgi:hypothetical protein